MCIRDRPCEIELERSTGGGLGTEQSRDHRSRLGFRNMQAQTGVRALGPGDVLGVIGSIDVEHVRLIEHVGVAVRGQKVDGHLPRIEDVGPPGKVTWAYVEVSRLALDLEEGGAAAEAGWLTVANVESGLHPHSRFAGNEYPGCVGGLGRRVGDNDRSWLTSMRVATVTKRHVVAPSTWGPPPTTHSDE